MVMAPALAALVMKATMPLAAPVVVLAAPVVTLIGPVPCVPAKMPFCVAVMTLLDVRLTGEALAALVISPCMPSAGGSIAALDTMVTAPRPELTALMPLPPLATAIAPFWVTETLPVLAALLMVALMPVPFATLVAPFVVTTTLPL